MHSMQRPEVFLLVHRLLPGFELQTSDVSKQQMKMRAKRRTGEVTASNVSTEQTWCTGESAYIGESITINRRIRFQRSTQQIGTPANRRTQAYQIPTFNRLVHRRIGVPAYQIPTFNTTDWYTGESAYRRIRFQRPTQQIGTPANRRTGVSDSNVQHNRLVHRRIGVPAYQIPTFNTTDWYTFELAYRRIRFQRSTQQIGAPLNWRTGVSDSNVQHNRLVHLWIGVPAYQIPTFNTTDWYTFELAYRRIRFQRSTQQIGTPLNWRTGVSDSNVQHNRLVHLWIGVPAYQIPTFNTTDWYTFELAYRRISEPAYRRTGEPASRRINFQRWRRRNRSTHIGPTPKHLWRPSFNPSLSKTTAGVDRPCSQLDALVDHSVRATSKSACYHWKRAVLL